MDNRFHQIRFALNILKMYDLLPKSMKMIWKVMFVFIPGSIPPVRFGGAGNDPAEISIPAVTNIHTNI